MNNGFPMIIPNLDIHPVHSCNLSCEQCTHLSNYGIKHQNSINIVHNWFESWKHRIQPEIISISGGEPLLHQDIVEFLYMTRVTWPKSIIRMFSNGLLLEKKQEVFKAIKDTNINLVISNHSTKNSTRYDNLFKGVKEIIKAAVVTYDIKIEIDDKEDNSFFELADDVYIREIKIFNSLNWSKWYMGQGSDMLPYTDKDPESSWKNCVVKQICFQLHNGKIYKCAPLAYLPMLDQKYGLHESWNPYLSYVPLEPNCTNFELEQFFKRGAEKVCSMCPAQPQKFESKLDPLKPIKFFKSNEYAKLL